jgi:hypothetical protein
VCCAIGDICDESGSCVPPPPPPPPTTTADVAQQAIPIIDIIKKTKCLNDTDCVRYKVQLVDKYENLDRTDIFYEYNIALNTQNLWTAYCNETYKYHNIQTSNCYASMTMVYNYCCNYECSEQPCNTTNKLPYIKWCLYDKYCTNRLKYSKHILEVKQSVVCPDHPHGLPVPYTQNENEALNWLKTEPDC